MKKRDLLFSVIYIGVFIPLLISPEVYEHYAAFSREWAFTASFLKFALGLILVFAAHKRSYGLQETEIH